MAKTDTIMGHMAYMLVHDFQVEIVMNIRAERKHGLRHSGRRMIQGIAAWARIKELNTIERHAQDCLEWIDSPLSDEEIQSQM